MMNKYRVHEVAKDFKLSTKEITEILTKYSQTPKNHMQVLEERELAIIFDYVTQKHQVESLDSVLAETRRESKAPAAPKAEQKSEKQSAPVQKNRNNQQSNAPQKQQAAPQQPVQMGGRPQANVAPQADEKAQKSAKPWFMFGKDGQ